MSTKVYCIAQFQAKPGRENELWQVLKALEPDTLREDGCLQYRLTHQIPNPFANGQSMPFVFNELWADMTAFERHCQRQQIQQFFATQCESKNGAAEKWNVCIYQDERDE